MIDAAERASMEETVRAAIADALATAATGPTSTRSSRSSDGWRCSTPSRADAIDIVFGALGATNATATALDDVLASALGTEPRADLAVLLPPFAAWDRAGTDRRERPPRARARDGSRRHARASCWWCAARRRSRGRSPFRRRTRRCDAVRGIDPDAGSARGPRAGQRGGRHAPRSRRMAIGRRARPARGRAPDRRRQPSHARPRAHARAGAGAVRSSDRAVPGRAPPARGRAGRGGGARGDARPRPGTSRAPTRRRSRRPSPDARRAPWPRTASRCSPASASPRSTRSTASSSGRWRSRGSSDRPTRSSSTSDGGCSPRATFRRSSSCDGALGDGARPLVVGLAAGMAVDALAEGDRARRLEAGDRPRGELPQLVRVERRLRGGAARCRRPPRRTDRSVARRRVHRRRRGAGAAPPRPPRRRSSRRRCSRPASRARAARCVPSGVEPRPVAGDGDALAVDDREGLLGLLPVAEVAERHAPAPRGPADLVVARREESAAVRRRAPPPRPRARSRATLAARRVAPKAIPPVSDAP